MFYKRLIAMAIATAVSACASNQYASTARITSTTSSGDVALMDDPSGGWVDYVNGTWMDSSGAIWSSDRSTALDIQPAMVGSLTNANILAHLEAGDSMEVALSQRGADRAQNSAVRDFAQRMVREHSDHLRMAMQMVQQDNVVATMALTDTVDAPLSDRMYQHLEDTAPGTDFDRAFMRDEVIAHQHMLHDLTVLQPQTSGSVRQLVDMTIPVVQSHLADARSLARQVGAGRNWWSSDPR